MSDDERPTTPAQPRPGQPRPAQPRRATSGDAVPAVQQRADAMGVGVRRALWPAFAIVLVIAAQAVVQLAATVAPDDVEQPGFWVVYSVMMLAVLPVLVTVGAAGATALLTKEPLPTKALAVVAGIVTAAWVAWVATGWLGLLFGVVLGATTVGAALVLTGRWSLLIRLPVAVVVAVVGAVVMLWVGTAVA